MRQTTSNEAHYVLTSAIGSAVHSMHLNAIEAFMKKEGMQVRRIADGWRAALSLYIRSPRPQVTVFFQSTGLSNLFVIPLCTILRYRRIYYLHEPTSLRKKISNGDKFLKALAMQAVQLSDCFWSNVILVSNESLKSQTPALFYCADSKVCIAPLLLPSPPRPAGDRKRITYLGRIDSRRYFSEFLDSASIFHENGFLPTILTGDVSKLSQYRDRVNARTPVDIYAQKNFPEELKSQILQETSIIWNPKSTDIAQSGVTADGLRYGTRILLSSFDPDFAFLIEQGIAIDYNTLDKKKLLPLEHACALNVSKTAVDIYERRHGIDAFRTFYFNLMQAGK